MSAASTLSTERATLDARNTRVRGGIRLSWAGLPSVDFEDELLAVVFVHLAAGPEEAEFRQHALRSDVVGRSRGAEPGDAVLTPCPFEERADDFRSDPLATELGLDP